MKKRLLQFRLLFLWNDYMIPQGIVYFVTEM